MKSNHDASDGRKQMDHRSGETPSERETSAAALEDQLAEIRDRLAEAVEGVRNTCGRVQGKAFAAAKYADATVRGNPWQAAALAFGVGVMAGIALSRRARC